MILKLHPSYLGRIFWSDRSQTLHDVQPEDPYVKSWVSEKLHPDEVNAGTLDVCCVISLLLRLNQCVACRPGGAQADYHAVCDTLQQWSQGSTSR